MKISSPGREDLSKGLFSYQMIMVVKPYPSPEYWLQSAEEQSAVRGGITKFWEHESD
jgi:hypothetical protein